MRQSLKYVNDLIKTKQFAFFEKYGIKPEVVPKNPSMYYKIRKAIETMDAI